MIIIFFFISWSGEVKCSQPIDVLSCMMGVYCVSETGKPASTIFSLQHYNETENTSIVKCKLDVNVLL